MLYPILTKTRKLYDLNGIWRFKQGSHDINKKVDEELMVVPSSFNDVIVDKDKRAYIGDFWYEREVTVPNVLAHEELVLRFGSVTHHATVYVNGEVIGSHKGGFTPFEFVIPSYLYQDNSVLTVTVCANNELNYTTLPVGNYVEEILEDGTIKKKVLENFDFFNYAGIHRPVKLYTRPQTHIQDVTILSELNDDLTSAKINVDVQVSRTVDEIRVSVFNKEQELVAQTNTNDVVIENVRLWEVLDGYLYQAKIELIIDNTVIDEYLQPFGVRKIEVNNGKFLINNKPFYFKGFGKHEDTHINGRGLNEAANLMDLNLLKSIGANSFRTSHYPYSEEMMRLADEMGIVVIDEVPAVGLFQQFSAALNLLSAGEEQKNTWEVMETKEAHEQVIHELIQRDKNHACVVMWVVANEPASNESGAREYFEPLIHLIRDTDPQHRPVTLVNIMTAGLGKDIVCDLVDVICLNRYYGWYSEHGDLKKAEKALREELLGWQKLYPNKPIMMTEYGADTLPGYHSMWDIPYTEEYQCDYYEMNHTVFDEIDNFVGEQVWNFADFETNVMLIRIKGNHKGLFSRTREPKQVVREFSKRWKNIPNYFYKENKSK